MSGQPECRGGEGRGGLLLVGAFLLALVALVGGCGDERGEVPEASSAAATAAPCKPGASILPHVPEAPAVWKRGAEPAIALACSGDAVDPGAAVAGYAVPGGGSCVSAYSFRLREAFDELCQLPGSKWTIQCDGGGCVHSFRHDQRSTVLAGPVSAGTAGIEVLLAGKALKEGVLLARVGGRLMRAIRAEEPFGFFSVYIPRCVEPGEIMVKLVGNDGAGLGVADAWDVPVQRCRPSA